MDFKSDSQLDKKFKSYKKDLNEKLKNKISDLKNFTFNQEKYNSLIAKLIKDMSLDENIDSKEEKDEKRQQ